MGLFDTILSAIDNPNQQASTDQLAGILNSVQQLSNSYQANPTEVQSAMSVVGKYVRSALQDQRNAGGESQAQALVNQFSGTQPSNDIVNTLFNSPQLDSLIREVEARTGLNTSTVRSMLPTLIPLVLNFLQTGASKQNPTTSNSVLSGFLDSDGDGDLDLMDAMNMASRYLQR